MLLFMLVAIAITDGYFRYDIKKNLSYFRYDIKFFFKIKKNGLVWNRNVTFLWIFKVEWFRLLFLSKKIDKRWTENLNFTYL